jgi:hypothetical protein
MSGQLRDVGKGFATILTLALLSVSCDVGISARPHLTRIRQAGTVLNVELTQDGMLAAKRLDDVRLYSFSYGTEVPESLSRNENRENPKLVAKCDGFVYGKYRQARTTLDLSRVTYDPALQYWLVGIKTEGSDLLILDKRKVNADVRAASEFGLRH